MIFDCHKKGLQDWVAVGECAEPEDDHAESARNANNRLISSLKKLVQNDLET